MGMLEGKVALITGAANGQGAEEARRFAAEGAALVLTDIDEGNGRRIADGIAAAGHRAVFVRHDVAEEADWREAIDRAVSGFGGLHILINNAGVVPRRTLQDTGRGDWDRTLAVNLTGPMIGMQLAAPVIRDSGGGSIVNVSSVAGLMAHYDAAYTASKWALRGLTKTAAVEYAPWGIRVNSIHPGQIEGTALFGSASPELAKSLRASIPMERAGTPRECADLALFLASDASSFITGAEIPVDGGYAAGSTMWMRQQLKSRLTDG
ncbi:glucose 1-dehydrogenase [Rhodobacterales bacterium HKCCE2091]|nr:glucose 1-dehydrogenase [Rhodobacterales bacterium HKCCE2091]